MYHTSPQATKDNTPSLGPSRRPMCNFTIDCTKSKDDTIPILQMPHSVTKPANKRKTQKKNPTSSSKQSSTKKTEQTKNLFYS